MAVKEKIGYIINESAVQVSEVDVVESGNRRVRAKGKLQSGGERNRNGRLYRTEDLAREIVAPRQRELLTTKNMLGEAGHPLSAELVRQQTIDPKCSCVRYLKFWMEGDDVMGIFEGTNNEYGKTFDLDLRDGVLPAFSLRALGTVVSTPQGAIVENLKMITYDYVIYPSHPGAYTSGIVNESAGMIKNRKRSHFMFKNEMDANKSNIISFTNSDVVKALKQVKESAIDYVKDKSFNYHLLKESYDLTKVDTVDLISNNKIALTESGNSTIVLNIEDYIQKELFDYL